MDNLPIFLTIKDKPVVVDGGGTVAARRIERALSAGAIVRAFDPAPEAEVQAFIDKADPNFDFHPRLPVATDMEGAAVIWGASEDMSRDKNLRAWADDQKILCNIADAPDMCDFITPSIVDRSPVVVAISTGGAAPVVARTLRARLEAMIEPSFGQLASFVGGFRDQIATKIQGGRERRHFWERMIDGPAGDMYLSGDANAATAKIEADLDAHGDGLQMGEVYMVGAGPGDPDLLTFKALRLMQRADVVLYDRLVTDEVLSLVRRDAERIFVGKAPDNHVMSQAEITKMMIHLAQEGNRVLRLKGGDAYIFGRGGEEVMDLAQAGVPFRVVPGITAAAGCATYAGIPLTHREHAQACVFVTAHGKDGVLDLNWDLLVRPAQTVAIYMGVGSLPQLVDGFLSRDVDPATDIALIENGTRPDQRVITGTLADILDQQAQAQIKAPAMILIGSVVKLRQTLAVAGQGVEGGHEMSLTADKSKSEALLSPT